MGVRLDLSGKGKVKLEVVYPLKVPYEVLNCGCA
jgi:hypothetical protein